MSADKDKKKKELDKLCRRFSTFKLKVPSCSFLTIRVIPVDLGMSTKSDLVQELFKAFDIPDSREYFSVLNKDNIVKSRHLEPDSPEYFDVAPLFNHRGVKLCKVLKILNPYLRVQIELKKIKKVEIYGSCVTRLLFHGTCTRNLMAICENNFNWRLCGTSVGTKFGRGMSFSPKASYAKDYPRHYSYIHCACGKTRAMFLATVINSPKTCCGCPSMRLPTEGTDHSIRPNGDVVVKYEDADYNPQYIILYTRNRFF